MNKAFFTPTVSMTDEQLQKMYESLANQGGLGGLGIADYSELVQQRNDVLDDIKADGVLADLEKLLDDPNFQLSVTKIKDLVASKGANNPKVKVEIEITYNSESSSWNALKSVGKVSAKKKDNGKGNGKQWTLNCWKPINPETKVANVTVYSNLARNAGVWDSDWDDMKADKDLSALILPVIAPVYDFALDAKQETVITTYENMRLTGHKFDAQDKDDDE